LPIFFSLGDYSVSDRIYIRGQAVHCALGDDIECVVASMQTNQVQVTDISLSLTGSNYSRPYYRLPPKNSDHTQCSEKYYYDVLFHTIEAAIDDAGIRSDEIEELPVFLGSTVNDIPIYEDTYKTSRNVLSQISSGYGNIANEIANRFNIKAACYTFTTACTSSANGIICAADMIVQGFIKRALVVGYDLFSNLEFYGFESLKLISPSPCKPFDKTREGIIIGEGCGALILDQKSKTPNDFHYLGGANICDTYSVTTHNPAGDQIAAVMREALNRAGIEPRQIDAVKAHATGSYHNDLTEGNGLNQVFKNQIPPVTGLKPFIGHTVGACGVIELILFTEAVKSGFIPATLGFEEIDDEINIEPITEPLSIQAGTFLLNYFGFGGNCVSLVVSNKPE
jgi:3-oxoacyl-[acyl-carrier-protein] synthase-1